MAAGVVLRIGLNLADRALWIDEAVLADNIVRRSFAELTAVLDHHQAAPVGFLWAQRLCVEAFGTGEQALRVVPLLAGILLMPAVFLLARRVLSSRGAMIALALTALSEPLIHFSNEVKPYVLDALAATIMLWLAAGVLNAGCTWRRMITMAAVGSLLVWFSFPIVFVLVGLMGGLFITAARMRDRTAMVRLVVPGLAFAVSFAANFLFFIKPAASSQALHAYWKAAGGFMPLPPRSLQDALWFVWTPFHFFVDPAGYATIGLTLLLTLLGAALLWQQRRATLCLLLLPIVIALAASALEKYPFAVGAAHAENWIGRLSLFSLPAMLLLIALGIDQLVSRIGRTAITKKPPSSRRQSIALVLLILLLTIHPLFRVLHAVRDAMSRRDIRDVFDHFATHRQPDDQVLPTWPIRQLALYYRHRIPIGDPTTWNDRHPVIVTDLMTRDGWARSADWALLDEELQKVSGRRLWIIVSFESSTDGHNDARFLRFAVSQYGRIIDEFTTEEGTILLAEMR